ncbi:YhgE/Pip domain-containing protein [Nocardioides dongkuii]|uniref:YhgE/Pip domain-containing protein n=1 Tax=Nocardioides dongkuii TaxID=2760089 RepID=UPI0015FDA5D0|nr:YhgE/Pip domain-containing protein [Nocardioides dongkuii]
MIAVRLTITELRRISAGTLPKLAVLAIVVIPSLYAGLYVYANKDPYGALGRVPAALVVQDRGATVTSSVDGRTRDVDYGEQVARRLLDGEGGLGWVETSQQEAEDGVQSGRFDAALFIRPGFSEDLTSTERYQPRQASLDLLTNDATNYLATTIAKTVADDVRKSIAEQVGATATITFLQGLDLIHTDLTKAGKGARRLEKGTSRLATGTVELVRGTTELASGADRTASGAARLSSGASRLVSGSDRLEQGTTELTSGLGTLRQRTASLPGSSRTLANGAQRVAQGNARVAAFGRDAARVARAVARQLAGVRADLDAELDRLVERGVLTRDQARRLASLVDVAGAPVQQVATRIEGAAAKLGKLSRGSAEVAAGTRKLANAAPELASGVARAASGADRVASGTSTLASGTRTLSSGASELASGTSEVSSGAGRLARSTPKLRNGATKLDAGTTKLRKGLERGLTKVPDLDRPTSRAMAQTVGDPVDVQDDTLARAGSYGAGLAPFFMSLAAWIGAYILFLLVRPLSRRALAADGPALRTALGGMLPPAIVGVFQMVVMLTVVRLALDLDPVHEVATVAILVVASAAFVAILQALNAWLGTVGEFLGLVLMLVQLVTAGGTFPWETIPEPLRSLHWLLPMTYAVDGLRQTLYGGELRIVVRDVSVLAAVGLVALLLTTWAARRQRVWTVNRLQPELVL